MLFTFAPLVYDMKAIVDFIRAEKELVIVTLAALLLVLLITQNIGIKRTNTRLGTQIEAIKTQYALQFDFATAAARMIGNEIPADVSITPTASEAGAPEQGTLLMIYNPTVCGRSVTDQLNILKDLHPLLQQSGLQLQALIGVSSQDDKRYTLTLQRDALLFYPFAYVEADRLSEVFPLQLGTTFSDTPLYFVADADGRIEAAFKPDSKDPGTLKRWLESISQARKKRPVALTDAAVVYQTTQSVGY